MYIYIYIYIYTYICIFIYIFIGVYRSTRTRSTHIYLHMYTVPHIYLLHALILSFTHIFIYRGLSLNGEGIRPNLSERA